MLEIFTKETKNNGTNALKKLKPGIDDEFIIEGIELLIKGVPAEVIHKQLSEKGEAIIRETQSKIQMVLEGLKAIQSGDSLETISAKCKRHH